jgi:hypothetical protein
MWKGEALSAPSGQWYFDLGTGVRLGREGASAKVVVGTRTSKERLEDPGRWLRSTDGQWWEVGLASMVGARANGRVDFTHTRSRYTDDYRRLRSDQGLPIPEDLTSSLGTARLSVLPVSWGPRVEVDYKVSGRQSERLVEELVPEEAWETNVGEYDSLGAWVGPEVGTHKKELVPSGGAERVNLVEGIAGLRLSPGGRVPRWRKRIHADVTARIQVTSRTDRLWDLYLLRPSVVLCDSTTLRQSSRVDGTVQVRPAEGEFTVGGQLGYNFDADNRRADRRTQRDQYRYSVRTRGTKLGRAVLDVSLYHARTKDWEWPVLSAEPSVVISSRTNGLSPSFSIPLLARLEAVGTCDISREHARRQTGQDSLAATDAVLEVVVATPGLRLAFPGRGRLRLDAELAWRVARGPWSQLAPFLRRTDREGFAPLIKGGGEYKLQEKLTLNAALNVGSSPGGGRVTEGSMELVAYF